MTHLTMNSTHRVWRSSRLTPLRVVAAAVLLALGIGGSGLLYCYLSTPMPLSPIDTMLFPRLPLHPF